MPWQYWLLSDEDLGIVMSHDAPWNLVTAVARAWISVLARCAVTSPLFSSSNPLLSNTTRHRLALVQKADFLPVVSLLPCLLPSQKRKYRDSVCLHPSVTDSRNFLLSLSPLILFSLIIIIFIVTSLMGWRRLRRKRRPSDHEEEKERDASSSSPSFSCSPLSLSEEVFSTSTGGEGGIPTFTTTTAVSSNNTSSSSCNLISLTTTETKTEHNNTINSGGSSGSPAAISNNSEDLIMDDCAAAMVLMSLSCSPKSPLNVLNRLHTTVDGGKCICIYPMLPTPKERGNIILTITRTLHMCVVSPFTSHTHTYWVQSGRQTDTTPMRVSSPRL